MQPVGRLKQPPNYDITGPSPMSDQNEQKPVSSIFERHLQTGIQALLVAVCLWMASTINSSSVQIAELSVEVRNLREQLTNLQTQASSGYNSSEAQREHDRLERMINNNASAIRNLEKAK